MIVKIELESGYEYALYGIGLSYGITSNIPYKDFLDNREMFDRLHEISVKLSSKHGGHNKFLETIDVFATIIAPRYWWQEFDTYRVGITKQSESTMHTLLKNQINSDMFEGDVPDDVINMLESLRLNKEILKLKQLLPESFKQKRAVKMSYMNIRNIISQRKNHRLPEWTFFCKCMLSQLEHKEYIEDLVINV